MSKRHLLAAAVLAALAGTAQADPSVNIVRNLAGPVAATTVTNYGAPDVLSGTMVTAFFNDGSSEQAVFAILGDAGAFAGGTRFAVGAELGADSSMPGNLSIVNLDNTATLVGFELDGRGQGSGGTVGFDVSAFTSAASTPGSNDGRELLMDFTRRSFITGLVTTTYSAPVSLNGAPAVGDLFAVVRVDLAYSNAGLNGGLPPLPPFHSQNFRTDVDTVIYAPVPEPASALLLAAGGALLLSARRRASRRPAP